MKVMVSIAVLISLFVLFEGSVWCVNAKEEQSKAELRVWSSRVRQKRQAGACDCKAVFYEHPDHGGCSLLVRQQNADFRHDFFDNMADSVIVDGPCHWLIYDDFFNGPAYIIQSGYYPRASSWGGHGNRLTSARVLPPDNSVAIVLFEHDAYQGHMVVLYGSDNNLSTIAFEDTVSSIIITGGSFTIYEHRDYKGRSKTLGKGEYSLVPNLGHDTISSIRRN